MSPLQIVLLFLTSQRSTMYPICISLMNWPTSADGNIYPQLMLMFRLSLVSKWRKFDKLHLGLTSLQSIVFTRVLFYPLLHNVPKWSNFKYLSCKIFKVSDHFGTLCIKEPSTNNFWEGRRGETGSRKYRVPAKKYIQLKMLSFEKVWIQRKFSR